ncbi:hypothetical protein A5662_18480 [Mycobacteriaceae bacterium 1482268.1]|nr:hypothetical protein A5662_18480 [Mycobacteriaceae bacterium 1482268.1]
MAMVWRYSVVNVDASLETFTSAERNCCHPTTTVKPSSAPKTTDDRQKRRQRRVVLRARVGRKDATRQPHGPNRRQNRNDDNDGQQKPIAEHTKIAHR